MSLVYSLLGGKPNLLSPPVLFLCTLSGVSGIGQDLFWTQKQWSPQLPQF